MYISLRPGQHLDCGALAQLHLTREGVDPVVVAGRMDPTLPLLSTSLKSLEISSQAA